MTAAVDTVSGSFDDPLSSDPCSLVGQDVEAGLVAAFRADNQASWARCRWLYEACRARAGTTTRTAEVGPRAALVAAAALAWSPAKAAAALEFARQVLVRLPALGRGMQEGWLEESKAAVFVSMLRELDDAQAREVLDRLLGQAAGWTHGELARRVEKTAAALDPGWYEARQAAAVARARVIARSAPSGAAELSGVDLPVDEALLAYEHVVAIADAVRAAVRARGGDVGQGFTEAHTYLALLSPALRGADEATLIATLTEQLLHRPDPDDDPDEGGPEAGSGGGPEDGGPEDGGPEDGGPEDGGPEDGGPDDGGPDDGGPDDGGPDGEGPDDEGPDDEGPDDEGPDDEGPGGEGPDGGPYDEPGEEGPDDEPDQRSDDGRPDDGAGPDDAGPDDAGPDDESSDQDRPAAIDDDELDETGPDGPGPRDDAEHCEGNSPPCAAGASSDAPLAFRAGVAVRLELTTLLGLDRRPGEVPEYGVVASSTARHLARNRSGAAIRLLLYDPDGHLEHVLALPPLGGRKAARRSRHRRQVIEVLARTCTLDALEAHDHLGQEASLLARAKTALATVRVRPPDQHPAVSSADAHRRHPGAALAAWIRGRDQTCRFPGCSRPAMRADLDHTVDWLYGGLTEADNLDALCESHHLLKHEPDAGWALVQPTPGHFVWTSPTGTRHHVVPERHDPLPDPRPPADGPTSIPDAVLAPLPRPVPAWAPRRNRHGHLTEAARATATRLARAATATAPGVPPSRYDHDPDF